MGSIIRSSGTLFYSLLYLNSRIGFNGLKHLYSVISVKMDSLPANTKKRESTHSWTARVRFIHFWAESIGLLRQMLRFLSDMIGLFDSLCTCQLTQYMITVSATSDTHCVAVCCNMLQHVADASESSIQQDLIRTSCTRAVTHTHSRTRPVDSSFNSIEYRFLHCHAPATETEEEEAEAEEETKATAAAVQQETQLYLPKSVDSSIVWSKFVGRKRKRRKRRARRRMRMRRTCSQGRRCSGKQHTRKQ